MIKVWTDAAESGLLDRHGERGSSFRLPARYARRARGIHHHAGAPPLLERDTLACFPSSR